jgi:hypothetical protein
MTRFSKTVLEQDRGRLRLLNSDGVVLLEIGGYELEDAIRAGYLDPESLHYSMFEFWRIRQEVRTQTVVGDVDAGRTVDRFIESLDFPRPDDEEHRAA